MCAPHFEGWDTVHGVPKGFLCPDRWDAILDGIVADDVHFDHVIFQWLGDPSLHPALPRLIGAAAQRLAGRVNYLRVDTNLIRFGPERIDALLDALEAAGPAAPPLLVVVTIDAHTESTYAFVKGQDALARVRRHVRHLVRARRRRGAACRVNLQLQFVVQEGNADELRPFVDHWADLLACQGDPGRWRDELCVKRLSVGGGAAGQAAADAAYEAAVAAAGLRAGPWGPVHLVLWERRPWQEDDAHRGGRTACPGLWLTPVIRQDGHLVMCCADLHSTLDLGPIGPEARFLERWTGPRATAERLAHLGGRFEGPCAGCGGIGWYTLPVDAEAQTAADARRHRLPPG